MKYHLYKSWQVTFANTYARQFAMDVDHLNDQFIEACCVTQGAFLTLSTSQPMRIEVLQSFPDISGDDLTLTAKQNFDPTTCPIVANVIYQLAVQLAAQCYLPVKEVEAAVQNVIYDDWEPLIEITKDQIADEAILKLLKSELMVAM